MDTQTLYLKPEAFKNGGAPRWAATGRTLAAALSPAAGEAAIWVSKKPSDSPNGIEKLPDASLSLSDETILFTSLNSFSQPLTHLYTESHLLFTSLQQIFADSGRWRLSSVGVGMGGGADAWDGKGNFGVQDLLGPPDAETVINMRRLADLYLDQLGDLKQIPDIDDSLRERFAEAYNILNLAEILYLPVDGKGEGFIGEELLDWVNEVDVAPDNQLGNEIMSCQHAWEHPSFWPYISRSVLRGFHLPAASFLRSLSSHSHQPVQKLASLLAQHLSIFPRSSETRWRVDLEFLQAHRQWLSRFRSELATHLGGKGKGKWFEGIQDGQKWEGDFRSVVELMEGKMERVLEESGDWREALGAWGVLVDVDLRRDHLPEIMGLITEKIPVETSIQEHVVESALCSADVIKALMASYSLDPWLSAHLSDLLDKLSLIPDDEEHFDISLRDFFLLEYAQVLQTHPAHKAFWRVTCDYLAFAGEEGRGRLKEHLRRIDIPLERDIKGKNKETPVHADVGMDVEVTPAETQPESIKLLDEVRSACTEFQLDDVWREISQVLATRLVHARQYGMAATLALMARDGFALSRIAEKVLQSFVDEGPEEYLALVDTLPPTLLSEAPTALLQLQESASAPLSFPSSNSISVFASRITFLSEFRDYILFLGQDGGREQAAGKVVALLTSGIAPTGFWGVLLVESISLLEDPEILFSTNETFELLRILEEVITNASFAEEEYLGQIALYLDHRSPKQEQGSKSGKGKATTHDARRKLEEARLALSRNLARAMVSGLD
ncbi:nuclear pore complex protein Nup85 [Cryptococcus wingfieldii CBS 7118]|uniref:Nuclear pore complex protein Nup85 n=1 Tax=Cryptococcus wingfieldii CBS 7118 TaxID=1295528 RepID=A0A1E3JCA9_9TREE|nr:nuclear pore complex protein Nup85 [Cryptococcus wingfieldii CBS 7118]ODN98518.1 nuclear pore complex protein Nup85 [Cryptococcus wingfieldii CBS 7118]